MQREQTDLELVEEFQKSGQAAVLDVLLRRHCDWIHRYCLLELGSEADANDCVQEVLLAISAGLPGFKRTAKLSTWIFVILGRTLQRYRFRRNVFWLRHSVLDMVGSHHEADPGPAVDSQLLASEAQQSLLRTVRRLPAKQRMAVLLHYFEDLPVEDVAERMGGTVSTCKVHLFKARKRLATLLLEQGYER